MQTVLLFTLIAVLALIAPHIIYKVLKIKWLKEETNLDHSKINYAHIYDAKIAYTHFPSKDQTKENHRPSVLCVHGIAANLYCWQKLQRELGGKYDIWALDLRGFGASDKPWNWEYDLTSQATIVREFIGKVIGRKTMIVASSMGCLISMEAAVRQDELNLPHLITGLIAIAPPYAKEMFPADLKMTRVLGEKLIGLIYPWLENPVAVKRIVGALYGTKIDTSRKHVMTYLRPFLLSKNARHALLQSMKVLSDQTVPDRINKLNLPILVLWGSKDQLINSKFATKIKSKIPNADVQIFDGGGHHLHEEEPSWVAMKVNEFTQRLTF